MNTDISFYAINISLLIGMNFLWMFPIRHLLNHPFPVYFGVCIIEYIMGFFIIPPILTAAPFYDFFVMLVVLIIVFFIGKLFTKYDTIKLACLFLWACALTSFSTAMSKTFSMSMYYLDSGKGDTSFEPVLSLIICIISIVIVIILCMRIDPRFLSDPNVPISVWIAYLPIPVIIYHQNMLHIAADVSSINSDQELYSNMMMLLGNLLMFVFLTVIFCYVAIMYVRNARVEEEKQILQRQQSQYAQITKDMERTNKFLHDSKHTFSTLRVLASENNTKAIMEYLDNMEILSYGTNIMNYCHNIAVNSVLNHYAFKASQLNIPIKLQVDLPETIPIGDTELCSMIGNLMENAIDACETLPEAERRFNLSIVMKGVNLYIVSSNTFDGRIEKSGAEYLSTKHEGFGVGIRSIRETVERYGGILKIYSKVNEFFVDIYIELSSPEEK